MISTYTLDQLKRYHNEAVQFFAAELMLLNEAVPKIENERLAQAATLLLSAGQTGAALLQLACQTDTFTTQVSMLARSFMETVTNFCYASICDDKEFRAFILHPIYKQYHNLALHRLEDSFDNKSENKAKREKKQADFKKNALVQEALTIFSDTKPNLNWTKKKLHERIEAIRKWGKLLDAFFTINKIQYYSDASEALHGSLYGCTYDVIGTFDKDSGNLNEEELKKKLYKSNACILLHLGMLIHESFTLISYSNGINEIWNHSYKNRGQALNLLFHIIEKKLD